jgi:hypothetical protein
VCLWSTIIDAERFRGLSDGAGWLYTRLYALAGHEGKHGVLSLGVEGLAWRLREPRKKLVARLEELRDRGLIGLRDDAVSITDWSREQAEETDAERKRRFRAQRKEQRECVPNTESEIAPERSLGSAASVRTTSGRGPDNVDLDGDGDRDGERDKDGERHSTSSGELSASSKSKPAKRKTPLCCDWSPNTEHEALARELAVDLRSEAAKFRDHAQANGRLLADWNAGFRGWLRNATRVRGSAKSDGKSRTQRTIDAGLEALRRIDAADARREVRRT